MEPSSICSVTLTESTEASIAIDSSSKSSDFHFGEIADTAFNCVDGDDLDNPTILEVSSSPTSGLNTVSHPPGSEDLSSKLVSLECAAISAASPINTQSFDSSAEVCVVASLNKSSVDVPRSARPLVTNSRITTSRLPVDDVATDSASKTRIDTFTISDSVATVSLMPPNHLAEVKLATNAPLLDCPVSIEASTPNRRVTSERTDPCIVTPAIEEEGEYYKIRKDTVLNAEKMFFTKGAVFVRVDELDEKVKNKKLEHFDKLLEKLEREKKVKKVCTACAELKKRKLREPNCPELNKLQSSFNPKKFPIEKFCEQYYELLGPFMTELVRMQLLQRKMKKVKYSSDQLWLGCSIMQGVIDYGYEYLTKMLPIPSKSTVLNEFKKRKEYPDYSHDLITYPYLLDNDFHLYGTQGKSGNAKVEETIIVNDEINDDCNNPNHLVKSKKVFWRVENYKRSEEGKRTRRKMTYKKSSYTKKFSTKPDKLINPLKEVNEASVELPDNAEFAAIQVTKKEVRKSYGKKMEKVSKLSANCELLPAIKKRKRGTTNSLSFNKKQKTHEVKQFRDSETGAEFIFDDFVSSNETEINNTQKSFVSVFSETSNKEIIQQPHYSIELQNAVEEIVEHPNSNRRDGEMYSQVPPDSCVLLSNVNNTGVNVTYSMIDRSFS